MRAVFWFSCLAIGLVLELHAAEIVPPGDYTTEGAWGDMKVGPADEHGTQTFSIESIGGNGHICSLEGEISRRQAATDVGCRIEFVVRPGQVTVAIRPGTEQECREHCGMRAIFDGSYYPKIAFCQKEQAVRADFLRLYQAKKFLEARDTLHGLLTRCAKFLHWHSDAEIRNDLAITEFRLGNAEACLRALGPLRTTFVEDPEKTGHAFTPVDEGWGEEMVKTTRFNWQKCGGVLPPLSPATR